MLQDGKIVNEIQATENPSERPLITFLYYNNHSIYYFIKPGRLYKIDLTNNERLLIKILDSINLESGYFFIRSDSLYLLNYSNTHDKYEILKVIQNKLSHLKSLHFDKKQVRIYEFLNKSNHTEWICTSNGVYILDSNLNIHSKPLFPGKNISYVYRDREGLFWFTSLQDGIFVIPSLDIIRYDFQNSRLTEDNLTALSIYDKKSVILGTHSGNLFKLDQATKEITKLNYPPIKTISTKKIYNQFPNLYVSHGPLTWLDATKNKVKHFLFYNIRDLIEYRDSFIFIYPENIHIIAKKAVENGLRNNSRIIIPFGGRDLLWHKGEVILSLNGGTFSYSNGQVKEIKFNGESIFATSMSSDSNRLFIGTLSHGILEYTANKKLVKFNHVLGLKENEIKLLNFDGENLWICTNLSLYRFNILSNTLVNISKSYGISGKNISSIQCDENKIYLATYKGLIEFPRNISRDNPVAPNTFIDYIHYQNKKLSPAKVIELPSDNSNLAIGLISTSLRSKGNYQYKYRLLGLDSNWINIEASHSEIVYSSIPPGSFLFQAKAINENEIEGNLVEISIHVDKFFVQ
ncbi:MAG: hypothetical protein IPK03_17230 [Bacteroidetes bacterium]|nr:hypothetical protein [Bacteroidota bacterium]